MVCLLLIGRKRRKKKRDAFFPGQDMPCWLCCTGFLWLLVAIKG
jgi:hypothetical protein